MKWKYIMIHCTATPAERRLTVADIDRYHREKGYDGIGYHFLVHQDGRIDEGRSITRRGAHCYGWNSSAIGIAYVGGLDGEGQPADTRTDAQKAAIRGLINRLGTLIEIRRVLGHNEVSNKACPCFDVSNDSGSGSEPLHPSSDAGSEALHPGFDADVLTTQKLKNLNEE